MNYYIGIVISAMIALGFAYGASSESVEFHGFPLLILLVIYIHAVQIIAFIPAKIFNTQLFYDVTGSITYITTVLAVCFIRDLTLKQTIVAIFVCVWAFRLGGFLFYRVLVVGQDSRFQRIKKSTIHFLFAWVVQGLWITITSGPVLVMLSQANPHSSDQISIVETVGLGLWVVGMVIEIISDTQKFLFKMDKKNEGRYIKSGLWAYSRHPNYFGQILLWTGVSIFAFGSLSGWEHISLISPVFVYLLLTKLSGVPILEKRADKKWGSEPEYIEYKKKTPILVPFGKGSSQKPKAS